MRFALAAFVYALAVLGLDMAAFGQTFPNHPIRVIIPWPVAGGPDLVARVAIAEWQKQFKETLVIENRPGANSVSGTRVVAAAPPDGYTLLAANTAFSVNPSVNKDLPYDSVKDFAPVSGIGRSAGYMLLVNSHSSVKSVADLIALAKKTNVFYGSAGIGNSTHLAGALFATKAGVTMKHIPYPGVADAMHAILTGEVTVAFTTIIAAAPKIESGELRAIGFTGETSIPEFPTVPPISATVPGYELSGPWMGMLAPAGTPAPIIATLNEGLNAAIKSPLVKKTLNDVGYEPDATTPAAFGAFLKSDVQNWIDAAKAAGVEPR